MTLTEFLLARIAEDDAAAQYAQSQPGHEPDWGGWWFGHHQHYNRHDPARVLAEVEAKRRIVEMWAEEQTRADIYNQGYDDGILNENDLGMRARSNARARGLKEAVLALAAVYSDHADYDEAWRV